MRARVEIQRHVARYTISLDEPIDQRTKHSLVKHFEQDLSHLPTDYIEVWSEHLDFELLAAKLYLYGLSFVSTSAQDTRPTHLEVLDMFTRDILQRGLATAVHLLTLVLPLSDKDNFRSLISPVGRGKIGQPDYVFQFSSYPKLFFLTIAFANFFLLWFLAVDPQASHTDKELARNYVSATYRFFTNFSNSPEHVRYGKTLEVLGRMPDLADANITVRRNSRLGASFFWEIIRRAVYHREASRVTPEAQRSASGNGPPVQVAQASVSLPVNRFKVPPEREQRQHVREQFDRNQSVGYGHDIDHSVDSAMEGLLPDPSIQLDQLPLFAFDDAGDWDFPWGVWDDAAFDALGFNLNTTPPYDAESFPQ